MTSSRWDYTTPFLTISKLMFMCKISWVPLLHLMMVKIWFVVTYLAACGQRWLKTPKGKIQEAWQEPRDRCSQKDQSPQIFPRRSLSFLSDMIRTANKHTHMYLYLGRAFELVVSASAARAWARSWSRPWTGPGTCTAVTAVFPLVLQSQEKGWRQRLSILFYRKFNVFYFLSITVENTEETATAFGQNKRNSKLRLIIMLHLPSPLPNSSQIWVHWTDNTCLSVGVFDILLSSASNF